MFKRFFRRVKEEIPKEGVELPEVPIPEPTLDLGGHFSIVLPVNITVDISPLETFSTRVIREYDIQSGELRKKVRGSIFAPQPNGKLRIYPLVKGEKPA